MRYGRQRVEIYNIHSLLPQGTLCIPKLHKQSWALTSCSANNCLYVSDDNNTVHKFSLTDKSSIDWPVGVNPTGLSVTASLNLLVTCCGEDKIQEFTPSGSLVREIYLQSRMVCPHHAVLLESGEILVSHGWQNSRHRICIVSTDGLIVRRYGNREGTGKGRLSVPKSFIMLKSGKIIVADHGNNRLVMLNSSLRNPCDLPVIVEGGLKGPWALCSDESNNRLYVGEQAGSRVIIIDNIV